MFPFPKLSTAEAYYKRNLFVYNFGVHYVNDSTAHMYVYEETEGGRGSEDISICLVEHIKENTKQYDNIMLFPNSSGDKTILSKYVSQC